VAAQPNEFFVESATRWIDKPEPFGKITGPQYGWFGW
jgi:hypothetical protein